MKKLLSILILILFTTTVKAQLELPYPVKVVNPRSLDYKYLYQGNRPYTDTSEVNATIPLGIRHKGLIVNVANQLWWYKDSILNNSLVQIQLGGGISKTYADYGLQNVNDSTLKVDTVLTATVARLYKVSDSISDKFNNYLPLTGGNIIGNVGLNVPSPTNKLDINGRIKLRQYGETAGIWFSDSSSNKVFMGVRDNADSAFGIWYGGRWLFTLRNDSSDSNGYYSKIEHTGSIAVLDTAGISTVVWAKRDTTYGNTAIMSLQNLNSVRADSVIISKSLNIKGKTITEITDDTVMANKYQSKIMSEWATKTSIENIKTQLNNKLNASAVSIGAGQVAFGSGTNTIGGDNGLYWDNTNKRLGIGTITPNQQLELTGNLRVSNTTNANKNGIIYKGSVPFISDFNYGYNGIVTTKGYNTIIGVNAGNLTMGSTATNATFSSYNTFLGYESGLSNTTGFSNTFNGYSAGRNNTTGYYNSFIGNNAGNSNTIGHRNTFVGNNAGNSNTTGAYNTFIGTDAGRSNTTGVYNTFLGTHSGNVSTTSDKNTFVGAYSGMANTTGNNNIFIGFEGGYSNTTGFSNTFIGTDAGRSNTTGATNSFIGTNAGLSNTTGMSNTFVGNGAGYYNNANQNTFVGYLAGLSNTTGTSNTLIGSDAGRNNTTGHFNTFIGFGAGKFLANGSTWFSTGGYSVFIGSGTKASANGVSNEIVIGHNAIGSGSNSVTIGADNTSKTILKGNIGIGITIPTATLHIKENVSTAGGANIKFTLASAALLSTKEIGAFEAVYDRLYFTDSTNTRNTLAYISDVAAKQDTITGAATTITTSNLTANRALISDGSGKVAVSSVTDTELGYVGGVTSSIQTQLNAKLTTANSNVKRYIRVNATTNGSNYAMDGTKEVVLIDYTDPCDVTLPAVSGLPDGSVFEIQFYNWAQTNKQVTIYPDGTDSETIDKGFGISSGGNLLLKSNPQANSVTPLSLRIMWLAEDNVWTVLQGGVFDY